MKSDLHIHLLMLKKKKKKHTERLTKKQTYVCPEKGSPHNKVGTVGSLLPPINQPIQAPSV